MNSSWNNKLISVIIPAFNEEKYIQQAIQSVLDQIYTNLELIIVDDGSTDNTSMIVKGINDPRITYIYQENASQAVARNTGLDHSSGDYVAFLDGDDYWHEEKLEKQIKYFDDLEVGLVSTDKFDVDGHRCLETINTRIRDGYVLDHLLNGNFITNSSVMIRKELMIKHKLSFRTGIQGVEDWDLWMRLSPHCKFLFIKERLCFYRIHEANISKNLVKMLKSHEHVWEYFVQNKIAVPKTIKKSGYLHYLRYAHLAIENRDQSLFRYCVKKTISLYPLSIRPYWALLKSLKNHRKSAQVI